MGFDSDEVALLADSIYRTIFGSLILSMMGFTLILLNDAFSSGNTALGAVYSLVLFVGLYGIIRLLMDGYEKGKQMG